MKRILAGLLLIVSLGMAQREDTVFDTLFENQATDGVVSNPVRNIGQSSHLITVILTDAPAQTCAAPATVDLGMEYSYDNVTYVRASGQITRVAANDDGILVNQQNVAGAYPFVRVDVRDFDTVTCRLTVKYSGAVAAFNVNQVGSSNNFLGIGAVSTLADPSGLNIQYTPSTPFIVDPDISNFSTFIEDVYDALDARWVTGAEVQASIVTPAQNTANCATWTAGEFTVVGDATFNAGATGTGLVGTFPNFFIECNYIAGVGKAAVAAFMNANNNLVDVTYDGGADSFTLTVRSGVGYNGFRGNALRVTGVETSFFYPFSLASSAYNKFINGTSFFRTQATSQGLQGCVQLNVVNTVTDNSQFFVTPYRNNCGTVMQDNIRALTNRGVQVRLWVDDYQLFSYIVGTGSALANTGTTYGTGVPWIPPFVAGVTEYQWSWCDNKSTTGTFANNWRTTVQPTNTATGVSYGASVAFNGATYGQNQLWMLIPNPTPAAWANASGVPLLDAILKFDVGGPSGTPTFIGQLWNAVYYQVNVVADTPFVFDGFTWNTFTNSNANGSLLLRQN